MLKKMTTDALAAASKRAIQKAEITGHLLFFTRIITRTASQRATSKSITPTQTDENLLEILKGKYLHIIKKTTTNN